MNPTAAGAGEDAAGRPLQDVYSVTLGVALALGVEQVIDLDREPIPVRPDLLLPFLAFLLTAFSLYHWAVRFVDVSYGERRSPGMPAIVTSLVVGSSEIVLLIALSILIARPGTFLAALLILLVFEVVAGLAFLKVGAYGSATEFAKRYLLINLTVLVCGLVGVAVIRAQGSGAAVSGFIALALSSARAIAFYKTGFRLLFDRSASD